MSETDGPVLINLDDAGDNPAEAPPILDQDAVPTGQAMQTVAALATRQPNRLARWFWRSLLAVIVFFASVSAWDFVVNLAARNSILGGAAIGLSGLLLLVTLAIILREWAALARLAKIDGIHEAARAAKGNNDRPGAERVVARLLGLYAGRADMAWGKARLADRRGDVFDADALLDLAEDSLLVPLDAQASREVEAAARQVATITALVPLAFADVIAALTANLRMIRRVAEIYGGRGGTFGTWRLARAVITHLVATGAVAIGDDLLGSIGGGQLLSKISRRFGEGLVNGALTARVGIAAMEVCRPLPFAAKTRPSVSGTVKRALTGLFSRSDAKD